MFLDFQNAFAWASPYQDIASATTHVFASGGTPDAIDLTTLGRDIGSGTPLHLLINTIAYTVGAGTSVDFQLITSAASALTSPQVVGRTGPIVAAQLGANLLFTVTLTPITPVDRWDRYLGLQAVTVGAFTTFTARGAFGVNIQTNPTQAFNV